MSWQGQVVAISGATGFLGSALACRLATEGAVLRALVRDRRKLERRHLPPMEVVEGSLEDMAALERLVEGANVVFHVAAALDGPYLAQFESNVNGTVNIAQAALRQKVSRFVHVSSIAAYGYGHRGLVSEDAPHIPNSDPYSLTKYISESALLTATKARLLVTTIRPGAIYGPGAGLWTRGLFAYARLRPLPFPGDGRGIAPLIYVDDVIEQMLIQAQHPQAVNQAFNAVHPQAITWREYLLALARLHGHQSWLSLPYPLGQAAAHLATLGAPLLSARRALPDLLAMTRSTAHYNMAKARDLLGWTPRISLNEGLTRLAPSLLAQS
ncbi:MAG: NAD-dependent epimerase/dehydratase family protein [Anaerolineae bacterium]|nr:NAD-dependent epimerase/dehydratase family protein [Anaerolineae bacterium]MDW8171458.1 NAD-dependent epimerase/dehydratase family protein [Anaerolineae bacterium]